MKISEWFSGGYCACHGDALLVFYKDNKKLETLSYHHSRSLRWYNGPWPGDAVMTSKSQVEIPKWFASQGYTAFEDQLQRKIQEDKRQKQERKKFASYFPVSVKLIQFHTFAKNPIKEKLKELKRKYPRTNVPKLYSSMMALGSRNKKLNYILAEWKFAFEYPGSYSAKDFKNAFDELKGDKQGIYGAACLFFKNEIEGMKETIDNSLNEEEKTFWSVKLAPVILEDVNDRKKVRLLDSIKTIDDSRITQFLLDVAHGKVGKEVNYSGLRDEEPGIRATAYLCLAYQGVDSVKNDIKEQISKSEVNQDKAALEVALALLGEEGFLKEYHFKLKSFLIGEAGLRVIEKNPSKENIDILVNAGIDHSWGLVRKEARYLFQKITKVDWLPNKGDKEAKRVSLHDIEEKIKNWWAMNRDKF